jgi:type IV pilus assembly protein PilF
MAALLQCQGYAQPNIAGPNDVEFHVVSKSYIVKIGGMNRIAWVCLLFFACTPRVGEKMRTQSRIHYDLGLTSFNQGDMRGALRELRVAAENDPTFPQVHNALGLVYHALGKREEAQKHYLQAVKLKKDFSEAYNNLGTLEIDLGHYEKAIAAFEKALSDLLYATPYLAEANMGWAYYKKGDAQQGAFYLRHAVTTFPSFCRGYVWLAEISLTTQQFRDVLSQCDHFDRYCSEENQHIPQDTIDQMQYFRGMSYLKQGYKRAAREALKQCATSDVDAQSYARECTSTLRNLR